MVSANEYSCAHGAQLNFGDLSPYLTYDHRVLLFAGGGGRGQDEVQQDRDGCPGRSAWSQVCLKG